LLIEEEKAFTNDRKNKCFVFVGYSGSSSLSDIEVIQNLWKRGFKPSFAFVNGYDYNDKLVFYALLEQTIDKHTSGYLTVAKFTLSESTQNRISNNHDFLEEKIISEELTEFANEYFLKSFEEFIGKYDKLVKSKATEKELIAITLDIYNKNRNIEAINSDNSLKKELDDFITACRDYYIYIKADNLSYILKFIVRYQQINFDYADVKASEVKQALQEKKVYKVNINRLFKGKNADSKELKNMLFPK
jgi:hypothetical protein